MPFVPAFRKGLWRQIFSCHFQPLRNGSIAGAYNAPGLPNIVGSAGVGGILGTSYELCMEGSSGALLAKGEKTIHSYASQTIDNTYGGLSFAASQSSPIYGSSSTVMPSSVDVIVGLYLGCMA